jgi:2-haloacid dehalogenase
VTKPPLGQTAPRVAVLDVNETLSDLGGLAPRMAEVGAPAGLLAQWFAATLRDGFALTAVGQLADFTAIGTFTLAGMLRGVQGLHGTPEEAADHVVGAMGALDLHAGVGPGLRTLAEAGVRIVTLSNGAAHVAESLLDRAGLRHLVERCLSVTDAGRWKPAPEAYAHAARCCGVESADAALIAVHPWDIDGAARAGLRTGWLARDGRPYPPFLRTPEHTASDLAALAGALVVGEARG